MAEVEVPLWRDDERNCKVFVIAEAYRVDYTLVMQWLETLRRMNKNYWLYNQPYMWGDMARNALFDILYFEKYCSLHRQLVLYAMELDNLI